MPTGKASRRGVLRVCGSCRSHACPLQPAAAAQGSSGSCTNTCQTPWWNTGHECFQFCHLQRHHLPPPGECAPVTHMCMHPPRAHISYISPYCKNQDSQSCLSLRRMYSRGGQGTALLCCQEQCICRYDPSIPVVSTQTWGRAYCP